jgi:hypothetical protein
MPIKYRYHEFNRNTRQHKTIETDYFKGYEMLFRLYDIKYKIQKMPFENNFGQQPNFLYLI